MSVEVGNVLRAHFESYANTHRLTKHQCKVMNAMRNCRTSILGGHKLKCDHCNHDKIAYNSCRDRHCPKCQSIKNSTWRLERQEDLLPVQYFHVVFTVPHELNVLTLYNKEAFYNILFSSGWETLKTLGADSSRLNGQMGALCVLHTWGQNLSIHNHIHCIIPGGAFTKDGVWKPAKKKYLFPVKVMSKLFKGIYISKLKELLKSGTLCIPDGQNIDDILGIINKKNWVVYCKPPFSGPEKLLSYLGRYVNKIAISNDRIVSFDDKSVTFKYRDYADNNKMKLMTLKADEFIKRVMNHILPPKFMRIRSFGFLSNAAKKKSLEIIRTQLKCKIKKPKKKKKKDKKEIITEILGYDVSVCKKCKKGTLVVVGHIAPQLKTNGYDTS